MAKYKKAPPQPIDGAQLVHTVTVNISEHALLQSADFDPAVMDQVLEDCIDDLEMLREEPAESAVDALDVVIGDLVALRDNLKDI